MYIGQGPERIDGRLKVTGGARYAAEFAPPGTVSAVLVQSTIALGSILAFDLAEAQAMPGVLAIITPDNAAKLQPPKGQQAVAHPLLQSRDVVYNGQHIAIAVADTFERATAAAAAVRVRYRTDEPVAVMDEALDHAYVPKQFRNGEAPPDTTHGDPDGSFAGAPVRVAQTYRTPIEHHNPMEPHATVAAWEGDRLTVWTATQGVMGARRNLATLFGIEPGNVTILSPYVGGGFGSKGNTWPPVALAALAARHVGRPVRLVVTRAQMFTSNGYRPRTVQTVKLGARADGTLVALRHDGITQMSDPSLGEFTETVAMPARMLYACPNIGTSHRLVSVNQGLPTYMRAPGEASGMFALESAMDELAVALRMDPIELRLRNYAESDPTEHRPFASKGLRECYAQGAAAFGWSRRTLQPRSMRAGRMLVGYGMATATYPTNRQPAAARVTLRGDGTALVECATQDIGTGTYTIMAQAAADELGLAMARVQVAIGDSRLPPAGVSGGSTTAVSVLPAVVMAARAARARLLGAAIAGGGPAWRGITPAQLGVQDGVVTGGSVRVPIGEIVARQGGGAIVGEAATKLGDDATQYSRHAFGAQFAEVHVDEDLGAIRVARWVGAFECGRVLNARTARSQMLGGITFGIGMALLEETRVDAATARYTHANIAEYLVPVNADIPALQVIVVDAPDLVTDPFGAKGVGELPTVGAAAAVANAVYHATGRRVRDLPIRVEDVLA
jgi:xanthine dehydrogenase YagR molybdenum-binding subunit